MVRRLVPVLAALLMSIPLHAQVTYYTGGGAAAAWQAAAGNGTEVTLDFEGFGAGTQANNPGFVAYAANAGIAFQGFTNAPGQYPRVENGNGGIGAIGANWLGNFPVYTFAEAIVWNFIGGYTAFSFYDLGSDDGLNVRIYGTDHTTLLGSFGTTEVPGAPQFRGFVSTADIGRVELHYASGNGFFGFDALTTVAAIPEPSTYALGLGVMAALAGWMCRRIRARWETPGRAESLSCRFD